MAQQVNVTIIGLDRIGTSFGMALKRQSKAPNTPHQFAVLGSDPDSSAMKAAHKLGAIDQEERSTRSAVEKADIVFVNVPYGSVQDLYSEIGQALKPGVVVLDASPLKLPSIQWANEHFRRSPEGHLEAYLVGVSLLWWPDNLNSARIHTESAQADLFDNGMMILSPANDCPAEAVQLAADLASALNLKAHFTDPAEYDGMMASMEGLPLLLQLALFRSINDSEGWNDLQKVANPSFGLGTYRLGQGTPDDYASVIHLNRENVLRTLATTIDKLSEVRDLIASGDDIILSHAFEDTMQKYEKWLMARRKNDWGELPKTEVGSTLNLLGPLGNLFSPRGKKKQ